MHVDVYNRKQITDQVQPDVSTCLISISTPIVGSRLIDPGYKKEVPTTGWKAVLQRRFHDVVQARPQIPDLISFDETMAEDVVDFIEANQGANFAVHCDAGVSRSVAVGTFMQDFYGYTLKLHATPNDRHRNILVYNLLRREAMKRDE